MSKRHLEVLTCDACHRQTEIVLVLTDAPGEDVPPPFGACGWCGRTYRYGSGAWCEHSTLRGHRVMSDGSISEKPSAVDGAQIDRVLIVLRTGEHMTLAKVRTSP